MTAHRKGGALVFQGVHVCAHALCVLCPVQAVFSHWTHAQKSRTQVFAILLLAYSYCVVRPSLSFIEPFASYVSTGYIYVTGLWHLRIPSYISIVFCHHETRKKGMAIFHVCLVKLLVVVILSFVCLCVCAQSCLNLCNPMDCSLPGSSVHEIFQAKILEWVAISSSRGSSWPRDWTHVSWFSCIGKWILYHCAPWFKCLVFPAAAGPCEYRVDEVGLQESKIVLRS